MIDKNTFSNEVNFHGSKGLLFLEDKIIIFRRDEKTTNFPLQIDLPGGGKEEGESPFETFKREVKEEFGLDIVNDDIVYSKSYQSLIDPGRFAYFMVTRPLEVKEIDIVFGDEGLYYQLITPHEFVLLPDAVKRQQERVEEYLEYIKLKK